MPPTAAIGHAEAANENRPLRGTEHALDLESFPVARVATGAVQGKNGGTDLLETLRQEALSLAGMALRLFPIRELPQQFPGLVIHVEHPNGWGEHQHAGAHALGDESVDVSLF